MYRIKVLNRISDSGLKNFPKERFSYSADMEEPDGILLRSAYIKDQPLPESVLAIARAGAGVNNIPVDYCTERGIPVFNTPGANANAVKEMVIAALYISSRNIAEAIAWVNTIKDRGDDIPRIVEDGKSQFVGPEVYGRTLGIIGLGAVGVLVANAATHLGLTVFGYDPFISIDNAWGLSRAVVHAMDIDEIFRNSDYITMHVPVTDSTKYFINRDSISKMKDGVRILNFARGELVNSEDMAEAVSEGKVSSYVTDFPDKHLVARKGVVAIPHLGASTPESEDNCADMAVRELVGYLERGAVMNAVNFPRSDPSQAFIGRVALFNKNIPGMLSSVTTLTSECSYNIENLTSSSNKGAQTAYTILDLDRRPEHGFIEKLKALPGVFRVRGID